MSDWDYIVGEGGYSQGFQVFEKGGTDGFDGTDITTVTLDIKDSDGSDTAPALNGAVVSIDTNDPLRVLFAVTVAKMPQNPGVYLFTFIMTDGSSLTRKTFEGNLQVHRG
jgi:hypothetical protein